MSRVEEKYRPAIAGKKLPIVTIDHNGISYLPVWKKQGPLPIESRN